MDCSNAKENTKGGGGGYVLEKLVNFNNLKKNTSNQDHVNLCKM
jgi:hypothetical protein